MEQRHWTISVNGAIGDPYSSKISVLDRGFLFGDSVYEVTTTRKCVMMFWEDHYDRLCTSAKGIGMNIASSANSLFQSMRATVLASKLSPETKIYIRLVVTRGMSLDIGLFPRELDRQNEIVFVQPFPKTSETVLKNGLSLWVAEHIERNSRQSTDPNLKTGNYLNSILALQEAKNRGFDDGIMLNAKGHVTEGTTFNIWGVKNGKLYTSALEAGILLGITRKNVFKVAAKNNLEVIESPITKSELLAMDELFVTSSGKDVFPVGKLNDKLFPRHTVTDRLSEYYQKFCDDYCSSHPQWRV